MRKQKFITISVWSSLFALACSISMGAGPQLPPQEKRSQVSDTSMRTRCDVSLPIRVELVPENEPRVGQAASFRVEVESNLDPDQVVDMRVEYETAPRLQIQTQLSGEPQILAKSGRSRLRCSLVVPDESRYSIRARLIVRLTNGKTISQTAVRWIDLGVEDPPEGMMGRIVNPDGTAIRVYQGETVRKPQ